MKREREKREGRGGGETGGREWMGRDNKSHTP